MQCNNIQSTTSCPNFKCVGIIDANGVRQSTAGRWLIKEVSTQLTLFEYGDRIHTQYMQEGNPRFMWTLEGDGGVVRIKNAFWTSHYMNILSGSAVASATPQDIILTKTEGGYVIKNSDGHSIAKRGNGPAVWTKTNNPHLWEFHRV
jgi:hypothetical protein